MKKNVLRHCVLENFVFDQLVKLIPFSFQMMNLEVLL